MKILTTEKFLPPLGHAIFVILHICEHEANRSLQISSLKVLLCFVQSQDHSESQESREQLGDIFAFFLPGISMSVANVLTKDSKQGNKVIEVIHIFHDSLMLFLPSILKTSVSVCYGTHLYVCS